MSHLCLLKGYEYIAIDNGPEVTSATCDETGEGKGADNKTAGAGKACESVRMREDTGSNDEACPRIRSLRERPPVRGATGARVAEQPDGLTIKGQLAAAKVIILKRTASGTAATAANSGRARERSRKQTGSAWLRR